MPSSPHACLPCSDHPITSHRERLVHELDTTGELLVDLGSDQTSCHNPFNGGYYPVQLSFSEAQSLMSSNPSAFKHQVQERWVTGKGCSGLSIRACRIPSSLGLSFFSSEGIVGSVLWGRMGQTELMFIKFPRKLTCLYWVHVDTPAVPHLVHWTPGPDGECWFRGPPQGKGSVLRGSVF